MFASVEYIAHQEVLRVKDRNISNAYAAYETLLERVKEYRARIVTLTADLERDHSDIFASLGGKEALKQELDQLRSVAGDDEEGKDLARAIDDFDRKLSGIETEWARAGRMRDTLRQQVENEMERVEDDISLLSSRQELLTAKVETADVELRKVVLQRDLAIKERDQLDQLSKELQAQLADLQDTQMAVLHRFTELTDSSIGDIETVLAVTGLDVNKLLQTNESQLAQGGPFIPAEIADLGDEKLNASLAELNGRLDRWDGLQRLQKMLPLGAPLLHYQITSYFGKRTDPLNKRVAMHEGIDLGAPRRTPIYAPAPGTVTFAGKKSRYGNVVIIDHGLGFSTLYGHMHEIKVKKGQTVDTKDVIGSVGTTGRSTGPHLHYEIRVGGTPRNPLNFIKAGSQYVLKK